jgi:hypothetical protein
MSYFVYELVEGPAYPQLMKKQRALAWASARSHLRRAVLDVPDVICVYGAEVSEDALESAVEKETGLNTRWLRFTLDEFAELIKRDLVTYHAEAGDNPETPAATEAPADVTMVPEEAPAAADVTTAPADVTMAPEDVVMAPAEASAVVDEISLAQEFPRSHFAAAKLDAAPARRGRPKAPLVCAECKLVFPSSDAKYSYVRWGKCIPV